PSSGPAAGAGPPPEPPGPPSASRGVRLRRPPPGRPPRPSGCAPRWPYTRTESSRCPPDPQEATEHDVKHAGVAQRSEDHVPMPVEPRRLPDDGQDAIGDRQLGQRVEVSRRELADESPEPDADPQLPAEACSPGLLVSPDRRRREVAAVERPADRLGRPLGAQEAVVDAAAGRGLDQP